MASVIGRTGIAKLLLAAPGIDINAKDENGRTALMAARRNGRDVIVELLLAAGRDDAYQLRYEIEGVGGIAAAGEIEL